MYPGRAARGRSVYRDAVDPVVFANSSEQATAVGDGARRFRRVFDVPGSIPSVRLSGRDVHDRRRNATRAVTDGVPRWSRPPPGAGPARRRRAPNARTTAVARGRRLYKALLVGHRSRVTVTCT